MPLDRAKLLELPNAELSSRRSAPRGAEQRALHDTLKTSNRNAPDVLAPDSCSGLLHGRRYGTGTRVTLQSGNTGNILNLHSRTRKNEA